MQSHCRARMDKPILAALILLASMLALAQSNPSSATPDLKPFAGTWKAEFKGHPFLILSMREQNQQLVGTCMHSRSINWGRDGELTIVSEETTDDKILDARASGTKLVVKIANADSPEEVVTIELKLLGNDQAEGRLLNLPPDTPRQKPWLFKRVAGT